MNDHFNGEGLILSPRYAETMEQEVLPRLEACCTNITVHGFGGRPLYACRYQADSPARGTMVMVHGFTENAFKFSELIHSLLLNGLCVVAYDQRGHGRSWRPENLQDPSLTHVDSFDEYEKDLQAVCLQVLKGMPKPWMLFSHSMGGAVSTLFLERHPRIFSRAVLSSPMIAVNLHGLPAFAAGLICRGGILLGKRSRRLFTSSPYAGKEDFETSCATGRERFDWYEDIRAARPEFQNNGPSYGWTLESLKVTKTLLEPGAPEKIACPVLLFSAENDEMVLNSFQDRLASRIRQVRHETVPGSRHEIYRSEDAVLFPWWQEVLEFLGVR